MTYKNLPCPFCGKNHPVHIVETCYEVNECSVGTYRMDQSFYYFLPTHTRTTQEWIKLNRSRLIALIARDLPSKPYTIRWKDVEGNFPPREA